MLLLRRIWSFLTVWWRPKQPLTTPWEIVPFKFSVNWYMHADSGLEKAKPQVPPDKENL